jgi:hypothetical protein
MAIAERPIAHGPANYVPLVGVTRVGAFKGAPHDLLKIVR